MAEHQPDAVDLHVGKMVRAYRKQLGMSQEALARDAGVTFQQIQKYERGANRVSASMLSRIAAALKTPIAAFFPDQDESVTTFGLGILVDFAGAPGAFELADAYLTLGAKGRHAVLTVATSFSDATPAEEPSRAYVTGGDEERPRHVA